MENVSVVVAVALAIGAFQFGFVLGRFFERWDHHGRKRGGR